ARPGSRRALSAALPLSAALGGHALGLLPDKHGAAVDAAVSALAALIPSLTDKQRKRLADTLIKFGTSKRIKLSPASEAGVMRLAGLIDDKRVAPLLWERVLPPHPPEARGNALQALGKWATNPSSAERQRLFRCAAAADFRIAAPALMILDRLPMSAKQAGDWIAL